MVNFEHLYSWILGIDHKVPKRKGIGISNEKEREIPFYVLRNASFEPFIPYIDRVLGGFGIKLRWRFSNYSNLFESRNITRDERVLIFIDPQGVDTSMLGEILRSAIDDLVALSLFPVNVLILGDEDCFADLISRSQDQKINFVFLGNSAKADISTKRLYSFTGIGLESKEIIKFALEISFQAILPNCVDKPKLVIMDLDNTLYQGVLAEQGINELSQDAYQRSTLKLLLDARRRYGVMTALCSRNIQEDVHNLLKSGRFSYIEPDSFDFILADWRPKENMIEELLRKLNISPFSAIFVDDSIFEIENVVRVLPVLPVNAVNTELTYRVICKLLDSFDWSNDTLSAEKRALDIRASELRRSIFQSSGVEDLLNVLETQLSFEVNNEDSVERAAELSGKTNQFNFRQSRLSRETLQTFLRDDSRFIVTVGVSDKLSKSGIVGLLVFKNFSNQKQLVIDEFVISCRALGRNLEGEFLYGAIKILEELVEFETCFIEYRETSRNAPCAEWVKEVLGKDINERIEISLESVRKFTSSIKIVDVHLRKDRDGSR